MSVASKNGRFFSCKYTREESLVVISICNLCIISPLLITAHSCMLETTRLYDSLLVPHNCS
jgi:hypothetical protein